MSSSPRVIACGRTAITCCKYVGCFVVALLIVAVLIAPAPIVTTLQTRGTIHEWVTIVTLTTFYGVLTAIPFVTLLVMWCHECYVEELKKLSTQSIVDVGIVGEVNRADDVEIELD